MKVCKEFVPTETMVEVEVLCTWANLCRYFWGILYGIAHGYRSATLVIGTRPDKPMRVVTDGVQVWPPIEAPATASEKQ